MDCEDAIIPTVVPVICGRRASSDCPRKNDIGRKRDDGRTPRALAEAPGGDGCSLLGAAMLLRPNASSYLTSPRCHFVWHVQGRARGGEAIEHARRHEALSRAATFACFLHGSLWLVPVSNDTQCMSGAVPTHAPRGVGHRTQPPRDADLLRARGGAITSRRARLQRRRAAGASDASCPTPLCVEFIEYART